MAKKTIIERELNKLDKEIKKSIEENNIQKNKFADEIKNGLGEKIIKELSVVKTKPKVGFFTKIFKIFQ